MGASATESPSVTPSASSTSAPTSSPTVSPTAAPTSTPTSTPTSAPTSVPTSTPTAAPTASPTSADTPEPTISPTALSCEDQADRFTLASNNRDRPCSWVLRNNASTAQINRRCALPLVGGSTVVSDHCPAACGLCSIEITTAAPTS